MTFIVLRDHLIFLIRGFDVCYETQNRSCEFINGLGRFCSNEELHELRA
jgi:hypothetical protein